MRVCDLLVQNNKNTCCSVVMCGFVLCICFLLLCFVFCTWCLWFVCVFCVLCVSRVLCFVCVWVLCVFCVCALFVQNNENTHLVVVVCFVVLFCV